MNGHMIEIAKKAVRGFPAFRDRLLYTEAKAIRDYIEWLERGHHEIRRECSQENCDGEPYDTFQRIANEALGDVDG